MPLYEFKCEKCHAIFERLTAINTTSYDCPICKKSCDRIISRPAPPIIRNNTPYQDNITTSAKELDRRIGETIDKKIRPIFEEREKAKAEFRQGAGESRLRRLPSKNPGEVEYIPADDQVVARRKGMLKEYQDALSEDKKGEEEQSSS